MEMSYGARLRRQREQRNISLASIADATKIKRSLLEGLERDDLSHWPAGIYRRSYVRAYAQLIGLDPDACLHEFLERYPDPEEELATIVEAQSAGADAGGRAPATRLRYLIDSAVGALPALRLQPGLRPAPAPRPGPVLPGPVVPIASAHDSSATVPDHAPGRTPSVGDAVPGDAPAPPVPVPVTQLPRVDFGALAGLCTRLACALDARDVAGTLEEAVDVLDAVGAIVWIWDARAHALAAVLTHGYADELVAQLPRVPADADVAIAVAFRSAALRVVGGGDQATSAVIVPIVTHTGCAGVLAFELPAGGEQRESVHAAATILAAQLAALTGSAALPQAATA